MKTNNKETFFETDEIRETIKEALTHNAKPVQAISIPVQGFDSVVLEESDEVRIVICYGNYAIYLGEADGYHWTAPVNTLVAEKTYDVDITWLDDGEITFDEISEFMEGI
jgi:hypothetical protein